MTDSFNIYNKKGGSINANSGRRPQKITKAPAVALQDSSGKKVPNTARNESSKSTPCSTLLKAAKGGGSSSTNHAKNVQSTGNMMTLSQGIFRGSSDRYLPLSSTSSIVVPMNG